MPMFVVKSIVIKIKGLAYGSINYNNNNKLSDMIQDKCCVLLYLSSKLLFTYSYIN